MCRCLSVQSVGGHRDEEGFLTFGVVIRVDVEGSIRMKKLLKLSCYDPLSSTSSGS